MSDVASFKCMVKKPNSGMMNEIRKRLIIAVHAASTLFADPVHVNQGCSITLIECILQKQRLLPVSECLAKKIKSAKARVDSPCDKAERPVIYSADPSHDFALERLTSRPENV